MGHNSVKANPFAGERVCFDDFYRKWRTPNTTEAPTDAQAMPPYTGEGTELLRVPYEWPDVATAEDIVADAIQGFLKIPRQDPAANPATLWELTVQTGWGFVGTDDNSQWTDIFQFNTALVSVATKHASLWILGVFGLYAPAWRVVLRHNAGVTIRGASLTVLSSLKGGIPNAALGVTIPGAAVTKQPTK